jgi:predicted lysophospholipase L1 biosynthesis ABC-type transport system permease subunit
MTGTLVGVVGVTFVGLLSSDTLCPDHRAWVQTLAGIGFFVMVAALVSLVRGWAAAPALTLVASALGVAIGLLDAVHSPTRGRLIALGFGLALTVAAVASTRVMRLRAWDRTVSALGQHSDEPDVATSDALPDPRDATEATELGTDQAAGSSVDR